MHRDLSPVRPPPSLTRIYTSPGLKTKSTSLLAEGRQLREKSRGASGISLGRRGRAGRTSRMLGGGTALAGPASPQPPRPWAGPSGTSLVSYAPHGPGSLVARWLTGTLPGSEAGGTGPARPAQTVCSPRVESLGTGGGAT